MAENKRTPDQVERDRVEIAKRVLRGELQADIARDLGVSQQQVSYDLKIIRQRWKQAQLESMDARIAQTLAEINMVKQEAWKGWDSSRQVKETTTHEEGGGGDKGAWEKTSVKREVTSGNPAFLGQILECIKQRSILQGLPTELKYQDLNAAIARVAQAGYDIREPESVDIEGDTALEGQEV